MDERRRARIPSSVRVDVYGVQNHLLSNRWHAVNDGPRWKGIMTGGDGWKERKNGVGGFGDDSCWRSEYSFARQFKLEMFTWVSSSVVCCARCQNTSMSFKSLNALKWLATSSSMVFLFSSVRQPVSHEWLASEYRNFSIWKKIHLLIILVSKYTEISR